MSFPAIYLASTSPRRQELLRQLGVEFEVIVTDVPETPHADEPPRAYVQRLAHAKAVAGERVARERGLPARPVLGADTAVVIDGDILGKPVDARQARAMLERLAGRTHEVLTAIALSVNGKLHTALSETRVTMARMGAPEIDDYWRSGEPADKAGGYAIQGRAAAFIERIEGSYSGVVGLPLYEVAKLLRTLH